ncbi:MAG: dephospho-CoA kinase [Bacteroidota bacterium]
MISLGITGGIGSGKSAAVARLAAKPGVRTLLADGLAKRLMQEDAALRADLIAAFGPQTYDADGRLNRAWLAQQVFGDDTRLAQLNALVHPRVRAAFLDARAEAEADGVRLYVYEAALLFETDAGQHLDAVAVVDAPAETRIARVLARDGVTRAQVEARMQHQLAPETLRARADYVLHNGGTLDALHAQVDALYARLLDAATTEEGREDAAV